MGGRGERALTMPMCNFQCCTAEFLLVSVVLVVYLSLNVGLNYYNNWLLSPPPTGLGFPAPLFYTMCHMIASLLGSSALMACRPELRTLSKEQFWSRKFKLCILSTLFCISIASNNLSLPHIGLSVNQVLKSCTALPVLFLAFVLEGKRYSLPKVSLIVLIVVGAVIAVPWGTPNADGLGVALSIVSTLAGNLKLFAVVVLPAMFIDHITSVTSWIGFVIFLAAALGYAVLEQKKMRTPQPATTAPTKGASEETPLRKGEEKKRWF